MTIATDGSCLRNGERDAQAGAGIFVATDHVLNQARRLPSDLDQSNQTGEVVATLIASTSARSRTRVTIETDSQTTMDTLTRWRKRHEDTGYILQTNAPLIRTTIAHLRLRKAHTLFKWIKGHSGHLGNEAADALAAAGANMPNGPQLPLDTPPGLALTGAKLQCITQKLAYRAIKAIKDKRLAPRPRAVANMDRITSGIHAAFGVQLHESTIWNSFQSKHVSRQASQYFWMAVHDGYMIGSHWMRPKMSDALQRRAYCGVCGECETMTHIILECRAIGQDTIWSRFKELWELTGMEWKPPTWGTSFGAACAVFKTADGSRKCAIESLWCILSTEALHLIWKLRCERVIQNEGKEFTEREITNRFYMTLDTRLNLDRRTAALAKGRKSLKPHEVERIWLPIIDKKESLPPKWVIDGGVLVGIKRGR
ncbi:ribonuclease H-like protein [Polyporus arcularius HHB13444]|uniref:ribonuclease H n=1 Tax=Polyporus arcularius HHB13444 TaxID=1314778 RepID=A0A5C3PI84_9APHY|nr:ribonuclease H-like protein [Polyporus arcularius HHB13444]